MDIDKLYEALEWLENAQLNIEDYEKFGARDVLNIAKEQLLNAIKQLDLELEKSEI